jgi:hypothetical protein
MCTWEPLLVQLLRLVDTIPLPPPPSSRPRGRPLFYPEQVFLKVLLFMVLRRFYRVHEVFAVLSESSTEVLLLRNVLFPGGKMPSRRTFERRLQQLPERLEDQIALLGTHLVDLLLPWENSARAAALDSTCLKAPGAPWHQKDRKAGIVPNTSIDTDAHWTKSGWHGWVFGYKLHLVISISKIWIPLAAKLLPANQADNVVGSQLVSLVRAQPTFFCGDSAYNCDDVRLACDSRAATLVASSRGTAPRTDDGVEVRKIIHALRHHAIENFNGLFKSIFDARRPLPTKGRINSQRFILGAVFTYQLALLYRYNTGELHQTNIKALLRSA